MRGWLSGLATLSRPVRALDDLLDLARELAQYVQVGAEDFDGDGRFDRRSVLEHLVRHLDARKRGQVPDAAGRRAVLRRERRAFLSSSCPTLGRSRRGTML